MAKHEDFAIAPLSRAALWFLPALWLVMVTVIFLLRREALLQDNPANPVPAWLIMLFGMALAMVGPFILLQVRRIRLVDGMLAVNAAGLFAY